MHQPVLRKEVIECLDPQKNENFIDCTIGEGGHAAAILQKNGPRGKVLGVELDPALYGKLPAAEIKDKKLKIKNRLVLVNDSYVNLERIVAEKKFKNVSGVLFDLGLSSWHLEESGRGFSFKGGSRSSATPPSERGRGNIAERAELSLPPKRKEPLDMRYSQKLPLTAEKILNYWSKFEIEKVLKEYGQEPKAAKIAANIVEVRKSMPIANTAQLLKIVERYSGSPRLTFQALRIAVNNELENLKAALPKALNVLRRSGRLCVISFHSLEDRIVKNFFMEKSKEGLVKVLTKKPVLPSIDEIRNNPRSRSAKLRCCQKLH